MAKGNILGVVSAKGGVGKTTIVANLGVALTKDFKKSVLAVDGNITAPNLALYLEMVRPPVTIHDVLKNNIPISHAIFTHGSGLDVVPGSIRELQTIDTSNIKNAIKAVSDKYDLVFLDSGPGVGKDVMSVLKASDELLIVTVPEFLIVATTYKTINLARKLGKPIRGIILNKIRDKKYEMSKDDVEECVGLPVVGMIREDSKIRESVNHGLSVIEQYPKSRSSREFKTMAADLVGEEYVSGFFVKIKMLFSLWKDLLFEKEETKVELWRRRKKDLWAGDITEKIPKERPRPVKEVRPEPEPKPAYVKPVKEVRPEPEPEPVEEVSVPTAEKRIKLIEAAIGRLAKNYADGLLAEPVYRDLRAKYTEELKKLRGF